jgi:peptidoglycan hydrolase-like protein with peptidoglycan-binding domain
MPKYGADGKFGAETETALKAFQKDSGLTADGICGKATWDALDAGTIIRYKVVVEHLSKSVADEIISKYGGSMTKEG